MYTYLPVQMVNGHRASSIASVAVAYPTSMRGKSSRVLPFWNESQSATEIRHSRLGNIVISACSSLQLSAMSGETTNGHLTTAREEFPPVAFFATTSA